MYLLDLCYFTLQSQLDEKDLMYLACACFVGKIVQELALSEGANNNRVFNILFKKLIIIFKKITEKTFTAIGPKQITIASI